MASFRVSVCLAAAILWSGVALADDAPASDTADSSSVDSEPLPDVPDAPNTTGPIDQPGPVSVTDINVVDGEAVGLIDDASGGLGTNMWVDSPRDQLEQLLAAVPIGSKDSVVRSLARRVLLTASESPVGSGKRALVTIRIEKLLNAGMVDDAGALAAKAHLTGDADFARVKTQAILLSGDVAIACGDATAERLSNGDVFWLELRAYCFVVAGDQGQVDLIDQLLDAQGNTDVEYRMLRDDAVQHLNYMPGAIAKPSAVHVFLLKAAGLPVPLELAAQFRLDVTQQPQDKSPAGYIFSPDQLEQAAAMFSPHAHADEYSQRRAALNLALADALGEPLPPDAVKVMATAQTPPWVGSRPSGSEWQKIEDAANVPGRRGEAVLRLIEALDARDLGDMAPDASAKFVRLLRQLSLDDEARLLAVHALAAYRDPPPPPAPATPTP